MTGVQTCALPISNRFSSSFVFQAQLLRANLPCSGTLRKKVCAEQVFYEGFEYELYFRRIAKYLEKTCPEGFLTVKSAF